MDRGSINRAKYKENIPGQGKHSPQWRHPASGTARCPPGPLGEGRPPPAPRTHSVLWTPPVLAWLSTCVRALGRSMATAGIAGRGWGRGGRGRHETAPGSEHPGGCSPGRALPVSPWRGGPGSPGLQRDLDSRREHGAGVGPRRPRGSGMGPVEGGASLEAPVGPCAQDPLPALPSPGSGPLFPFPFCLPRPCEPPALFPCAPALPLSLRAAGGALWRGEEVL